MVYSTRRFVLRLALCYFVRVFFLCLFLALRLPRFGKRELRNLSVFLTFVRFALVWFCLFPLPLGVWEGLRLVVVALPGLFSYLFVWVCGCSLRGLFHALSWSLSCVLLCWHHENPYFYIVKLGFTGVYIIFLILLKIHRLWVLVRTASPRRF